MQNKTIILHISHEFIHYTLFSVNCNSVLLSTLAQAFWIEHYEEIKKLSILHISCSRICIKKVILGVGILYTGLFFHYYGTIYTYIFSYLGREQSQMGVLGADIENSKKILHH